MEDQASTSSAAKGWFVKYGSLFIRIIGIIADVYAVITIFSANSSGKLQLNPFLGLGIWFIALMTYFSILDWIRVNKYQNTTTTYQFIIDVVVKYKYPVLFIPIAIFIVLFIWSIVEITIFTEGIIWGVAFGLGMLGMIVTAIISDGYSYQIDATFKGKDAQKAKEIINTEWKKIDKIIQIRLKDECFIGIGDLHELQLILGLNDEQMPLILANYAVKHPQLTAYDTVYYRKDRKPVYSTQKLLINRKMFPNDSYYF